MIKLERAEKILEGLIKWNEEKLGTVLRKEYVSAWLYKNGSW